MPVRESLNKHPKTTGAVIGIVILASVSVAWIYARPPRVQTAPLKGFYTTDDSSQAAALAALFEAEADQEPPFDHDGKPAYRAAVCTTDGGKTRFIAYLERLTPKGKQMLDDFNSGKIQDDPTKPGGVIMEIATKYTEVKKPGDSQWVREGDAAKSGAVTALTPPDGSDPGKVRSVLP